MSVHEALLRAGFLVIPVDSDKQPVGAAKGDLRLCYQAPDSRECRERIARVWNRVESSKALKRRQTGLALLAGAGPLYPEKYLLIIDVDKPDDLPPEVKQFLDSLETWRWKTGPRCPQDGEKHVKCDYNICTHGDHKFSLGEARRGGWRLRRFSISLRIQ